VERELERISWGGADIELQFLEPRLACLLVLQELLDTECDEVETAQSVIAQDWAILEKWLPQIARSSQ
jgi:hypothetical protein